MSRRGDRRDRAAKPDLLADEVGTIFKEAACRVALVYPSPYRVAMSSLGYQQIYRILNNLQGVAADRAMLPDDDNLEPGTVRTLERDLPLREYPMLAFSVAYELEIAGLISLLENAGIKALASERGPRDPLVVAGGPLTFSNPAPLGPFCDLIIMGEGEELIVELMEAARTYDFDRESVLRALAGRPGYYFPEQHGNVIPPVVAAEHAQLPAQSVIITPNTELANMFMTEAARGCSRGCTYCVMRRSTNGGMRMVDPDIVLGGIPEHAKRVGLVGAAVTDHPQIEKIVRGVVEGGRKIGISSLRADKLDDELVRLLALGGYRTLTVAADGVSERMRRIIERSTQEKHLLKCSSLAAKYRIATMKIYMMVGVPGETDDDIDELVRFTADLCAVHPKIAYGIAPFVAKRNTPLDGTDFAGIDVVDARLTRLRTGLAAAGLGGKAEIRPTSARWAWVEYMLAQGDAIAGLALMDAHRAGGSFGAYKRAFAERGVVPTGPRARVPSSLEMIAIRKRSLAMAT